MSWSFRLPSPPGQAALSESGSGKQCLCMLGGLGVHSASCGFATSGTSRAGSAVQCRIRDPRAFLTGLHLPKGGFRNPALPHPADERLIMSLTAATASALGYRTPKRLSLRDRADCTAFVCAFLQLDPVESVG